MLGNIELNDGQTIPPIGLGTWPLSDAEAERAVGAALAAGYRLIDTASVYGNEAGVGRAIRASGVPRAEIVVTSKLDGADHGFDATLRAFEASLGRLGLDTLDLYLIHWPLPENNLYVDSWKAFLELHRDGRVRSIGVSNFEPSQIERIADATGVLPSVNQVELNPQLQQAGLRAFHDAKHIVTEAYSPLGRGELLTNQVIVDLAKKHERTPAQIALRWCVELGIVPIPKSETPDRIVENFDVFNFALDTSDLAAIARLDTTDIPTNWDPRHASES
jgi:2,5-diketo-D-gluconate reductase A